MNQIYAAQSEMGNDARWWREKDEDDLALSLVSIAERVRENDHNRHRDNRRYTRMYGGRQGLGQGVESLAGNRQRLQWNICKSMVDTAQAKIAKNRPTPVFLTQGGNFSMMQRAKRLGRYTEGVFYKNKIYDWAPTVFRDAQVVGSGATQVWVEDGDVKMERVFPWELYVDQRDAVHGKPRSLYRFKTMDRQVLKEAFPKHEGLIDEIPAWEARDTSVEQFLSGEDTTSDLVEVVEAWHLPSGKDADDGRHVIAAQGVTLSHDEYKRDRFPFVFMNWSNRLAGFWGMGLVEELVGIQVEINTILQGIQEGFHLGSQPFVFVERGTKVNTAHLNNRRMNIIEYTGGSGPPPQIQVFQTTHPEVYQHLERLYARAFQIAGISELSASAKVPSGIDRASGKALLVYNDIESERFVLVAQAWEQYFMDLADHVIELSKEIASNGGNPGVKARRRRGRRTVIEQIKWDDVNMERDAFELKVMPASSLPNTPAGRTAIVEQWIQAGFINREQAMQLLDFPDIDNFISVELSSMEAILDALDSILEDGEYISPEPYDDLEMAIKLGSACYQRAKIDRVPEDKKQLLRDYMDAVATLMAPPEEPEIPQAPMAPEGPGVPPQPGLAPAPGGIPEAA